jgi:hypothetical protein
MEGGAPISFGLAGNRAMCSHIGAH